MATKEQLLEELKELGVKASSQAPKVELEKLLESKKARITPDVVTPDVVASEEETTEKDYLRKYQFRKNTVIGSPQSDPQPGTKAAEIKKILLQQPKVRIFVPREPNEDKSIKQSVTLNGYRLDLPKQTYVEVPKQVAEVIMDSQKQTDEAIGRNQINVDQVGDQGVTFGQALL